MEAIKNHKWTLAVLFVINFAVSYLGGYYLRPLGLHLDYSEDCNGTHCASDLDIVADLFTMLTHFNFMMFFESLWILSPILFSLAFAFGMVNFYFILEVNKRTGEKHIAEKIMEVFLILGIVNLVYIFIK